MKAAVYYETGGPEVFRYEDVPDPELDPHGVILEVTAVSVEGGDVLGRAAGEMTASPHIVGYQCAGTVVQVGEQVSELVEGMSVVSVAPTGSHAALRSVAANTCWPIPDGLGAEEAACVPIPFGTADDCLFEFGRLQPGETVLVHAGGSGVGIAAIQLAKRAGATVIATASRQDKLDRLTELGMDHRINYATGDFVGEVRALTDGHGADVVVDSVGGRVLDGSMRCLAYRGRCVWVGDAGRSFGEPHDVSGLRRRNQALIGVFLGPEITTDRVRQMIARHLADAATGELKIVIDRRFPLSEAAAAHAYIESRQAFGRVVLIP